MRLNIKSLPDPKLTDMAETILAARYLIKDEEQHVIETPKQLFVRVAQHIAEAEALHGATEEQVAAKAEEFYRVMADGVFLPNTPTLINAGRPLGMLSACFLLKIEDSMTSIYQALYDSAIIFQRGGGVGYSFSDLRPAGDVVKSTSGTSSGVLSFMRVFNVSTDVVKQAGVRRGAMMGVLNVHHPEILEFISCKRDTRELTNFNLSVAVTDKFMRAVKDNRDYDIINPRTKKVAKRIKAREVFDKLVDNAWATGEPGIVFIDTVNRANPTPELGEIKGSNPCGELFAQPNTSCNLGSINVGKFFDARNNNIDYERLRTVIRTCVDFLDNTIDVNKYPLPAIDAMTKKQRPIGLGMMGFADLLYKWRVPYNTEAGREVASNLIKFFKETALERSIELAGLRGPCPVFAAREKEADAPIARNATLTVLAPTGTISMIAGASGGIEPQFGLVYTKKNVLDGKEFKSINEEFRAALQEHGIEEGKVLEHLEKYGSIKDCALVPDHLKRVFVTAYDIAMDDHVRMQAAFQKYTDSGISKTCNAPRDATRAQIADMFMLAYDLGCKGITVYRDGSRENQILNVGPEPKKEEKKEPAVRTRTRPQITYGATPKLSVGCGSMYMTLNEDAKGLCEIFIQVGKSGGCTASQNEALARIISLALRSDVQVHKIIKELEGIRCPSPCMIEGGSVLSCADAIAKGLKDYSKRRAKEERAEIESERPQLRDDAANAGHNPQCPVCGAMLAFKEGCVACMACGWSRCG